MIDPLALLKKICFKNTTCSLKKVSRSQSGNHLELRVQIQIHLHLQQHITKYIAKLQIHLQINPATTDTNTRDGSCN